MTWNALDVAATMNSTSVVERVTIGYFFKDQEIAPELIRKHNLMCFLCHLDHQHNRCLCIQ
jgi:hypothetical protein